MGVMGKSVQRMAWKAAAPVPAKKGWGSVPKAPTSYWDWLPEELRDKILDEARVLHAPVLAKALEMERSELEFNTPKPAPKWFPWHWDEHDWEEYNNGDEAQFEEECLDEGWDWAVLHHWRPSQFRRTAITEYGWKEARCAALARADADLVDEQWDRFEDGLAGSAMQRYLAIT